MTQVKLGAVIIDAARADVQRKEWNNPLQAIRAKCLECSGGSATEVRVCTVYACPLWKCRMGTRPKTLAKSKPELLDPVQSAEASIRRYYAEVREKPPEVVLIESEDSTASTQNRQPVGVFAQDRSNVTSESDRDSGAEKRNGRRSPRRPGRPVPPGANPRRAKNRPPLGDFVRRKAAAT